MKKAKLFFGDHEPREEIKTRIPVWLYPSTLEVIDRAAETVNCKSRSEYLERAALFYAGYISGQDATAYLPPALSKVMRGIVRDTENRICRLLFKLAVELDMVMNLLAKDRKGNLKASRVLQLREIARRSGYPQLIEATDIIQSAYRPVDTCQFISVSYKDEKGVKQTLPLSMAAME